MLQYKVVETTTVTDEALEEIVNAWTSSGWEFDDVRFVSGAGSRRPGMAFLFFTRRRENQSSQSSTSR